MKKIHVDYEAALQADLGDPAEAAAYLNAALEDGSQDEFLMALRDVALQRMRKTAHFLTWRAPILWRRVVLQRNHMLR